MLKAAHCKADALSIGWRSSMSCTRPDEIEGVSFRPGSAYCTALKVRDAKAFYSPVQPEQVWLRFVRGSTVLVVKAGPGGELFRIDHDQKGYLK